jgi:MFS family permease
VWRSEGKLYLALVAMCIFSVAVQVFFPYLIIYMQKYLGFENYAIALGIVLIVASVVSVLGGRVIDKVGKMRFVLPAAGIMLVGLVGMYFVRSMPSVIIAGIVMMSGYMLVTAALNAEIRDCTPEDKAGHFQGVRMVFSVMIPMIIGPAIGAAVIRNSALTYEELGEIKTVPTPAIFLAAAVTLLLVLIPIWMMNRRSKNAD